YIEGAFCLHTSEFATATDFIVVIQRDVTKFSCVAILSPKYFVGNDNPQSNPPSDIDHQSLSLFPGDSLSQFCQPDHRRIVVDENRNTDTILQRIVQGRIRTLEKTVVLLCIVVYNTRHSEPDPYYPGPVDSTGFDLFCYEITQCHQILPRLG